MKWLNLLGLCLQFISFWFAAPELLGETTLKRMEKQIRKLLSILPNIILMAGILVYAGSLSYMGFAKGIQGAEQGMTQEEFLRFIITLGICSIVYIVFLIFFKRIQNWLDKNLAQPLTQKLVENNEFRFVALKMGAVLFTLGFVFQLVVGVFG